MGGANIERSKQAGAVIKRERKRKNYLSKFHFDKAGDGGV
jgi:hypothetical protein